MGDSFFSDLKLRAGWGQTGNQEIPNKITKESFTVSTSRDVSYPIDQNGPYPVGAALPVLILTLTFVVATARVRAVKCYLVWGKHITIPSTSHFFEQGPRSGAQFTRKVREST